MLVVLALGFASGLPLALTGSTLTALLQESGISKASIGLFASIGTPYAFKFLVAPFIDGCSFPFLSKLLGQRRGWIVAMQIALVFSICLLSYVSLMLGPWYIALAAVIVATFSASQDVVIDAYRVEILDSEEQKTGAGVVQFGYRFGMLASGAGALALADIVGWTTSYFIMAGVMALCMLPVLFAAEPKKNSEIKPALPQYWLRDNVIAPFKDFMKHEQWLHILLFVMLYKFGDAFLGIMTNPFLLEIGFTKSQIAAVVKVYGLVATLIGLVLGSTMMMKVGMVKTLMVCGIGHAITNLMFLVQVKIGADINVLALGIFLENLSGGMTAAAFVAFISALCNTRYTATQYALLSSLSAIGRTMFTTPAGWAAEKFGWEAFFIISVLLAIPGLVLLVVLSRKNAMAT